MALASFCGAMGTVSIVTLASFCFCLTHRGRFHHPGCHTRVLHRQDMGGQRTNNSRSSSALICSGCQIYHLSASANCMILTALAKTYSGNRPVVFHREQWELKPTMAYLKYLPFIHGTLEDHSQQPQGESGADETALIFP